MSEHLYQELANEVLNSCPSEAAEVRLRAELDEDYSEFDVVWRGAADCVSPGEIPFDRQWRVHELLTAIRDQMHHSTGHRWSKCEFTISSNGRFKLEVEYEAL